jgi:hypothetical protein
LRAMRSLCSLFFIKPQSIPLNPIQLWNMNDRRLRHSPTPI